MLYNRFAQRIMKNTKLKLVQTSTQLNILAFPQKYEFTNILRKTKIVRTATMISFAIPTIIIFVVLI